MNAVEAFFDALKDLRQYASFKGDSALSHAVERAENAALSEILQFDVYQESTLYDEVVQSFSNNRAGCTSVFK